MGQDMVGETEGQRRFADTLRPFDEDRVVTLAGGIGARKKILRRFVTEETGVGGRVNCPVQHKRFALSAQTLPVSLARVACMGSSGSTMASTFSAIASAVPDASTTRQRSGSASAMSRK